MFTIEFFALRPGIHVVRSETYENLRLAEAGMRAQKRLDQLRREHPYVEIDGYRIMDKSGTVVLRSSSAA